LRQTLPQYLQNHNSLLICDIISDVIIGAVSMSGKVVMLGKTTSIPRGAMPAHLPVLAVHLFILFARGER
jgi:hypothetical protein